MGETQTRYHVALDVDDRAGVLAAVAQAFAEHDVSIQTVRQEGRGDDAQLVVVSHRATDAALAATVEALRAHGLRARRLLGDARRGRRRVSTRDAGSRPPVARRDRGVPRPGSTSPTAPRPSPCARAAPRWSTAAWLSELHRRRGVAQGRGRQPHRLVQGPRHDRRAVGRRRRGRRGRGLRLDRQHVGVDGGVRRPGRGQAAGAGARRARSPPASSPRRSCTAPR